MPDSIRQMAEKLITQVPQAPPPSGAAPPVVTGAPSAPPIAQRVFWLDRPGVLLGLAILAAVLVVGLASTAPKTGGVPVTFDPRAATAASQAVQTVKDAGLGASIAAPAPAVAPAPCVPCKPLSADQQRQLDDIARTALAPTGRSAKDPALDCLNGGGDWHGETQLCWTPNDEAELKRLLALQSVAVGACQRSGGTYRYEDNACIPPPTAKELEVINRFRP